MRCRHGRDTPDVKVATWNINSVRLRIGLVARFLKEHQPDVLALQEIKMIDAEFPALEFDRLGYQAICSGQPSYNGVALLTKKDAGDANFQAAKEKFGERGVVDMLGVMGYYQFVSMLLNVDGYPLPDGEKPELKPLR